MTHQGPPLVFTLSVASSARVGEQVPVILRMTNSSDRPTEVHFVGRTIAFDIVVMAEDGAVAWRRLAEGAGQSILQIRTLSPGETIEWQDHWIPKAKGRYRIQGVLPSDDAERRTAWTEIEVR